MGQVLQVGAVITKGDRKFVPENSWESFVTIKIKEKLYPTTDVLASLVSLRNNPLVVFLVKKKLNSYKVSGILPIAESDFSNVLALIAVPSECFSYNTPRT